MSLLSKFFGNANKSRLSKIEFWKKFELKELIQDLTTAQELIENNQNIKTNDFKTFADDFDSELFDVSHDNVPDFTKFWRWFSPKGRWNQYMAEIDEELRKNIFLRTDKWKRSNE